MSTTVILVSHGDYAQGLHHALKMFVGDRNDVISIGLHDGEDSGSFKKRSLVMLNDLPADDECLVLADLIGGSPLTSMMSALEETGRLANTMVLGGMNLAMALNAVLLKDAGMHQNKEMILAEAHDAIKEFQLQQEEEDEI